jgi:hypothetical protein
MLLGQKCFRLGGFRHWIWRFPPCIGSLCKYPVCFLLAFRRTLATGLDSRVRVSRSVGFYSAPEPSIFFSVIEPVSFGGDGSDFLHVFLLSGLTMVGNLGKNKGSMSTDPWVGEEILGTSSHFVVDRVGIVPRCPIGRREDWEILLPKAADRVCSRFPRDRFPMHEATFKEVGF